MSENINELDDLMGFDPSQLDAFNPKQRENFNANIYKTNPKDSKSDDGHYRSRVKILYNPLNIKRSIVHQATYYISDAAGSILVKSKLGDGDKSCPIFTTWKKLWFSEDPSKKELATSKGKDHPVFDKSESDWVLVQILEDNNRPELVGKILVWKLPACVNDVLQAKMHPSPDSGKKPIPLMDYIIGQPLEIDVTPGPDDPAHPERKQREISYSLCAFADDPEPIINTDGTPFFNEEELENIENYVNAKKDLDKAKTQAKKQAAEQVIKNLFDTIKGYYARTLNYIKEHAIDLVDECAYKPWDEALETRINHWCEMALDCIDPKSMSYEDFYRMKHPVKYPDETQMAEEATTDESPDDLPF